MDFENIEDKIIETLRAEVGDLRTVETYAGQLEGEIEKLVVRFPAAFVAYGGSTFEWVDGPNHRETAEFSVLVAAKSLRSAADSFASAKGLVKAALAALTNEDFGLDMEKLRLLRTTLVFTNKSITVYGLDFQTSFDTTYNW
jgi:phage gp37-like protein